MLLKVLVDNNTYIDQYYIGEPAVSYYIEIDHLKILFDTGYSDILIKNAASMNINLSALTHIVLSHGHNDHSKGLKYLCDRFDLSNVKLIAHPFCFQPKQFGTENIGSPFSAEEVAERFHYLPSASCLPVSENCFFLGQIPEQTDFEKRKEIGRTRIGGKDVEDYVLDDTALVCNTDEGIFIVTGCSHSGICNIVSYARKICNSNKIAGIIGGFHLFETDTRLQKTIEFLETAAIGKLYPCHCVSLKAKAEIMKHMDIGEVGVGLTIRM